jgi:hypothetical protein
MLYGLGKAQCPKPCFAKVPAAFLQTSASPLPKFDCHDAVEGDWCYHSINWLREKGLSRHPDWYPTLQPSSNNSWIQAELHRKGKSDCPWPCGVVKEELGDADEDKQKRRTEAMESMLAPEQNVDQTTQDEQGEEDCRDAQPNTACYTAVTYGLSGGIKTHPDMYKGLTENSNFKEVQEFLYLQNRNGCERPCAQKHISSKSFFNDYNGGNFREKKRIEDMSTDELSKYLDGKWDGFALKKYKVSFHGEVTSTFRKRSSIEEEEVPTTTPFGSEEQASLPLINPEASEMSAAEADRWFEETRARQLLEEKKRMEAATTTLARQKKNVEDMSHDELKDYLEGHGDVEPALPALGSVSTQKAIANATAVVDEEALPEVNGSETQEAANVSETDEAANGSEFEELPELALENFSTVKVSEDAGISDQPMPAVDADGNFVLPTAAESQPNASEEKPEEVERKMEMEQQPSVETEEVERKMEMEQQPTVETEEDKRMEMEQQPRVETEEEERRMEMEQQHHVETPEEMESRIRAEVMKKNDMLLKESEEEMRTRIKAEVMYDLSKDK